MRSGADLTHFVVSFASGFLKESKSAYILCWSRTVKHLSQLKSVKSAIVGMQVRESQALGFQPLWLTTDFPECGFAPPLPSASTYCRENP